MNYSIFVCLFMEQQRFGSMSERPRLKDILFLSEILTPTIKTFFTNYFFYSTNFKLSASQALIN